MLLSEKTEIKINFLSRVYSILKTRHLFPGKVDILTDFYRINSEVLFDIDKKFEFDIKAESEQTNKNIAQVKKIAEIIVVDTIAEISISNSNFYEEINHYQNFKRILSSQINDNKLIMLNSKMLESEIDKLISNNNYINYICEMELKFSPIITLKDYFESILVMPNHRGFDVIGTGSNTQWPKCLKGEAKTTFQKKYSKNNLNGRFRPMTLMALQINDDAKKDFPLLSGCRGSFIPYIYHIYPNNINIEELVLLFLSEFESDIPYIKREFDTLKNSYAISASEGFIPQSFRTLEYYRRRAEQGIPEDQYNYAVKSCEKLTSINKNTRSLANICYLYLKQAADQGHIKSINCMATMIQGLDPYFNKKNIEAIRSYLIAAKQGCIKSQYELGEIYETGLDIEKNIKEAVQWYLAAASQGCIKSQYKLGGIHEIGLDIEKNIKEAVQWYLVAATQGCIKSQYKLGGIYEIGLDIEKNIREAVQWYLAAASKGCIESQYKLGIINEIGWSGEKNDEEAVQWYLAAASKGHVKAQYKLGIINEIGWSGEKNDEEAVFWYRSAAEQGDARSQYNLGKIYQRHLGEGKIAADVAQHWITLASQQEYYGEKFNADYRKRSREL
jgi:TPR repeat protein